VSENLPVVTTDEDGKDKGEAAVVASMEALKKAIDSKDRKAIGMRRKSSRMPAKQPRMKPQEECAQARWGISSQAGRLPGRVTSSDNIMWSIYVGIAFLILSAIAMAFMGEKVGLFIAGFPVIYIIAWVSQFIAGNYRSFTMDWNTSCGAWFLVSSSAM